MYAPGEYAVARGNVERLHGEQWAVWLDQWAEYLTYGEHYSRGICDNVVNVFVALRKGDDSSATYWASETERYRNVLVARMVTA